MTFKNINKWYSFGYSIKKNERKQICCHKLTNNTNVEEIKVYYISDVINKEI